MIALAWFACSAPATCDSAADDVKIVDWHTVEVGAGGDLHGVSLVDGAGFVVGAGGAGAFTTDGGETWVAGAIGTTALFDVARTDDELGIAVGAGGTIRAAQADSDFTWSTVTSGTSADLFAIDLIGQNGAIAGDGVLLRSTDAGASWSVFTLAGTFRAVTLANATPWAVGDAGVAAHWDGAAWQTAAITTADLAAVAFVDADHGVAAGDGEVWVTSNAGASWQPAEAAPTEALTAITTGGGALLATGATGTIYRSQDNGQTWIGIHPSGIVGLAGISVYEDNTMPNSQIVIPAPEDRVVVYGSRFETADVSDRWGCP